ncbi:MAG: AMP-binding protein, partial [Planctomycetes bacterium]|nr:AMP-binding protein [Planctomycetota bacterium]
MVDQINEKLLIEAGASDDCARRLLKKMQCTEKAVQELWYDLCNEILLPEDCVFSLHLCVFNICKAKSGNPQLFAAWAPSAEHITSSNIDQVMRERGIGDYADFVSWSHEDTDGFVDCALKRVDISFAQEPRAMRGDVESVEQPQWLPDAQLNIVESCFQADDAAIALRMHGNNDQIVEYTYADLRKKVAHIVAVLRQMDLPAGARIGIALPMHFNSVAILLAIIAAGYSAVMIAESFSAQEIAVRFAVAEPVFVFTQDYIARGDKLLPLYEKVQAATAQPCIVVCTSSESIDLRSQDALWNNFISGKTDDDYTYAAAEDEIMVLFSSGTTGDPKAIPWCHLSPIKAAMDGHFHHDIHPGDVLCWPTSLGWMMGPWLVFSTLINKGCIALTGEVPATAKFAKFVEQAQVSMLGLVPSIVSAWRANGNMESADWSRIKTFSSTGECSNAADMLYLMYLANYKPIIEYCGGTETAGGYITGTVTKPCVPGCFSSPALGFPWVLLDEDAALAEMGEVFFQPPVLGLSTKLINADHHQVYFAGCPQLADGTVLRRHGDQIQHLGDGYYRAHGRLDDAMNLGGIKVSSVEIEELLNRCDHVRECAALAVPPE